MPGPRVERPSRNGGADPWVTLIDVFGAVAGATRFREPAPRGGQFLSSVRNVKSNQHPIMNTIAQLCYSFPLDQSRGHRAHRVIATHAGGTLLRGRG